LPAAKARRTLAILEERRVPVIVPSGSCGSTILYGYLDEPAALERAERLAGSVEDPRSEAEGAPSSC
jgi:hypothetical protein